MTTTTTTEYGPLHIKYHDYEVKIPMAKKTTTKKTGKLSTETTVCVKECSDGDLVEECCGLLSEIQIVAINALPTSGQGKDAFKDIIGKIEDHLQKIATK